MSGRDFMGPVHKPPRSAAQQRLRRSARAVVQTPLELLDPSVNVLRRRTRGVSLPPVALASIYRRRFAGTLKQLLEQLPGGDPQVGLWSLDEVEPDLARVTVGSGPGQRFGLLNRLVTALDLPAERWLLVVDDDVRFKRGTVADLVRAASAMRLDLCQPAHAWDSEVSHRVTRRRMAVLARRTGWVEQGPAVLLSPRGRARLLPFADDLAWPAWGIEARWSSEERRGLRFGIVDAVTMVHLQPVSASGYSPEDARRREHETVRAAGFRSNAEMQVERSRWRPWRPMPTAGDDG